MLSVYQHSFVDAKPRSASSGRLVDIYSGSSLEANKKVVVANYLTFDALHRIDWNALLRSFRNVSRYRYGDSSPIHRLKVCEPVLLDLTSETSDGMVLT
jgi:hypothetical protein